MEAFILIVMGTFVNAGCYLQMHGLQMAFFDPDDYMRLVRIKDFFIHGDLANSIISRSNVPFGCDLHWTRFYDFFIIIPAYILNIFIDSIDRSIEYVGFFISPIVKCVTLAIFFNIAQKLMTKTNAFLAAALFAAHPLILTFGIFGRPDHHAFIMLFIVIFIQNIIGLIKSKFLDKSYYVKTAIATVLCVWISPETLIPLLLVDAILFVYSFNDVAKLQLLYAKNILVALGIGTIIYFPSNLSPRNFLPICILLTTAPYSTFNNKYAQDPILKYWHAVIIAIIALLFPDIAPIEYDKISAVHMALYLCSVAYLCSVMIHQKFTLKKRIWMSFLWFVTIAAIFLSLYPSFLNGMSANIDDYIKSIWLNRISEMQSPFAHGDYLFFIVYCVIAMISIVNACLQLTEKKFVSSDLTWWIIIVNAICYTILAGISYRMLPYSAMFLLPIIVNLGMNGDLTKRLHRLWKIVVTSFISIFFIFCTAYFPSTQEEKTVNAPYTDTELFEAIDKLSRKPIVIMAHSNDGPIILYHTKHSVVGAPYHRQIGGIIFSHKIMEDQYNEETAKRILKLTDSSYIFVRKKKHASTKTKSPSLAHMIANNELPQWLNVVELPKKFDDIAVAKIVKDQLS
jgi:hypothetical protein